MAEKKTIVVITGANGGIGFELAAQLLSDASKHVLLGSRSVEKGEAAVKDLQARNLSGTVELLQLDFSSEESIATAAKNVESKHGRIDALVNNAGIGGFTGSLAQRMSECFQTNSTGPLLTCEYFAPLLKKSIGTPRIVNITSGLGSITNRLDSAYPTYAYKNIPYRTSKAALNMVTACQAVEYGDSGFKVFAFCPGFTDSNLGPTNNLKHGAKPTSEGAAPIVPIINGERDAEHGKYLNATNQYPW